MGKGVLGELAKIIGPIVLKEGISIGSALIKKKIAGKKRKGKGLRPTGARAPARRRIAPMPRPRPRPKVGRGKKKKKGGRRKY